MEHFDSRSIFEASTMIWELVEELPLSGTNKDGIMEKYAEVTIIRR